MFIFIAVSRKNIFLIGISAINTIISVMIWLDFDANITAIMRIGIAILAVVYYLKTINSETKTKANKNALKKIKN